jgi:hypothetical protein
LDSTNKVTPLSKALLDNSILVQLVKKLTAFMEPENSSLYSKEERIEPLEFSPHIIRPILILSPIYV